MKKSSILYKIVLFLTERSFKEIVMIIVETGPIQLLRRIIGLYFDENFDKKYNVNTSGSAQLNKLKIIGDNKDSGVVYDPIPHKTFNSLLKNFPDNLSDYFFVDFGSGKGRTLLIASSYNFRKIIGVEFAEELHEIALSNIALYRNTNQKCFNIESIHTDATLFQIPEGKTIFYFFVPFSQNILYQVLKNIEKSYLLNPRKMFVLYVSVPTAYPIPFALFKKFEFLHKTQGQAFPFDFAMRWPLEYTIYETREA